MMRNSALWLVLTALFLLSACESKESSPTGESTADAPPVVVVVNYPLEFIVDSLAGSEVKVLNPVPSGADPETWIPDDEVTETIQRADLIITNGADFADWVKKLSLPRSKVLRTSLSLKDALVTVPDFEVHSHGTGGAHSHAGTVAFFWLDPNLMYRQAEAIAQRLVNLNSADEQQIESRLLKFKEALAPLNQQLDQMKADYSGRHWFSRRPVYQYLARRCGWEMFHLHWKPGAAPTESEWVQMQTLQKEHQISGVLWERSPGKNLREKLDEQGLNSFVLNPLTTKPAKGDYLSVMQEQLSQLAQFLKLNQPVSADEKNPK
ncbi:MAG: metal ABC transporter substrate-binding protein [bacterium]|nr:metal ABC transporter substrate-binding protein [bacterium]